MNNRIEWIDAAKGMGIFLVVLGHMLPGSGMTESVIWTFHMPLFFFLSGITARAGIWGSRATFVRGLRGIINPYLFFSIVSIAIWIIVNQKFSSVGVWATLLAQMLFGVSGPDGLMRYNVPIWFFTCLLSVRLLFFAITSLLPSTHHQALVVAAFALSAHLLFFPLFAPLIWNFDVALSALVFYFVGYALKNQMVPSTISGWQAYLAYVFFSVLLIIFAVRLNGRIDMNGRSFGNPAVFYVGAFAGVVLTSVVAIKFARFEIVTLAGRASRVIFPLHALFWMIPSSITSIPRWYAFKITHSELMSYVVMTIIEIALCMPVYFAISRWAPSLLGDYKRNEPSGKSVSVTGTR